MILRLAAAAGAAVLLTAAAVAPATAAPPSGKPFTIELTGAAERPGPGDADATGTATLRVNPGLEQVCWTLSWQDVDGTVVAAHIHVADVDSAGPVVVPLFTTPASVAESGCADVDRDLAKQLIQQPESYYVNVHSTKFPAGAIRGQLG